MGFPLGAAYEKHKSLKMPSFVDLNKFYSNRVGATIKLSLIDKIHSISFMCFILLSSPHLSPTNLLVILYLIQQKIRGLLGLFKYLSFTVPESHCT